MKSDEKIMISNLSEMENYLKINEHKNTQLLKNMTKVTRKNKIPLFKKSTRKQILFVYLLNRVLVKK